MIRLLCVFWAACFAAVGYAQTDLPKPCAPEPLDWGRAVLKLPPVVDPPDLSHPALYRTKATFRLPFEPKIPTSFPERAAFSIEFKQLRK